MSWRSRIARTTLSVALAGALLAVPPMPSAVAGGVRHHGAHHATRNGQIAYAAFDQSLGDFGGWVANAEGSSARSLGLPSLSYRLAWSPDGNWLVVQGWQGSSMRPVVVRPDGRDARVLHPPGLPEQSDVAPCVWTPNGRQLVCQVIDFNGDHSRDGLWLIDARDGRHPHRLTVNPYPPAEDFGGGDIPGSVSPDGEWVVFTRARPDVSVDERQSGALFIVRIDGKHLRRLTDYGLPNSHDDAVTSWSPDGRKILFGSADGRIFTIRPDGSHLAEITLRGVRGDTFTRSPGWSPDGKLILARIYVESAGGWGLYTFTAQGSRLTRVEAPEDAEVPVWGARPAKR